MAKDRPPSFQWYPRDFAADPTVLAMTDAEELAYRRALDASWLDGAYGVGSPDEWCRWGRVRGEAAELAFLRAILPCLEKQPDGTLAQIRMARTRMEQELFYRAQVYSGRIGGLTKARLAIATLKRPSSDPPGDPLPSASASAVESTEDSKSNTRRASRSAPRPESDPEGFLEFYQAYPRREGRRAAAKAFLSALKRNPTYTPDHLREGAEEVAGVAREAGTETRFIPLPATWLNQDRFRDLFDEEAGDAAQAQETPE